MAKRIYMLRARFTRWYFRAGYEAEGCPWWLRLAARRLLSMRLYLFMAARPMFWTNRAARVPRHRLLNFIIN